VTRKTVFNHFPTKEDLALDRAGQYERDLAAAVRDRPEGTSVLEAFRALSHRHAGDLAAIRRHARAGTGLPSLIDASPALQQRVAEHRQRLVSSVAEQLRDGGLGPDGEPGTLRRAGTGLADPWPEVVAWTLVGAQAVLFRTLRELAAGTAPLARAAELYAAEVDRVFDNLGRGM
jgi:AcrR family transcriptional regulator